MRGAWDRFFCEVRHNANRREIVQCATLVGKMVAFGFRSRNGTVTCRRGVGGSDLGFLGAPARGRRSRLLDRGATKRRLSAIWRPFIKEGIRAPRGSRRGNVVRAGEKNRSLSGSVNLLIREVGGPVIGKTVLLQGGYDLVSPAYMVLPRLCGLASSCVVADRSGDRRRALTRRPRRGRHEPREGECRGFGLAVGRGGARKHASARPADRCHAHWGPRARGLASARVVCFRAAATGADADYGTRLSGFRPRTRHSRL